MKEEFWTVVCERVPHLRILMVILFVLLTLTLFSLALTPAGSASNIVAKLDLLLLVVALSVTLYLQWRCAKNQRIRGEWRPEERNDQSDG